MAHLGRHLISFLLFLVIFGCPDTEARQGKVFTNLADLKNYIENNNVKVSNENLLKTPTPSPAPVVNEISFAPSSPTPLQSGTVPAPAPSESDIAPAPLESGIPQAPFENGVAPAPVESDNAYGLGRGYNNQNFSKKTSYTVDLVNHEDEIPTDEFETESTKEFNSGESYNNYGNNYDNNGYYSTSNTINGHTNSYNYGNGYVQRQGMSDTRFLENGKYYYDIQNEKNYNNQNGYESVEKNGENGGYYGDKSKYEFDNGFVQRQGMSDTRFLENGKYYHDVQNENYNNLNGYESVKQSGDNEGYYGDKSKYEFDSTEEYERQQGYYVP